MFLTFDKVDGGEDRAKEKMDNYIYDFEAIEDVCSCGNMYLGMFTYKR